MSPKAKVFCLFFVLISVLVFLVSTLCYQYGYEHGRVAEANASFKISAKLESEKANYQYLVDSLSRRLDEAVSEKRLMETENQEALNIIKASLVDLCQRSNISRPGLRIHYNRKELQSWTSVLLYNADAMPAGKFLDRNGYIFSHHAKVGQAGMYLGQDNYGRAIVFFAGEILRFKPCESYIKQGALVYHF